MSTRANNWVSTPWLSIMVPNFFGSTIRAFVKSWMLGNATDGLHPGGVSLFESGETWPPKKVVFDTPQDRA